MNKSIIAVDISSEDRAANPDKLTPASARNSALSVPFRECADARATHDRRLALDSAKATYASRTSVAPAERPCNCEAEENPVRTRGASRRPARFTSGSRELRRDSVAVHFHRYPTPPQPQGSLCHRPTCQSRQPPTRRCIRLPQAGGTPGIGARGRPILKTPA